MTTNATAGGARITAGRAPRTLLELIVNQTDPTAAVTVTAQAISALVSGQPDLKNKFGPGHIRPDGVRLTYRGQHIDARVDGRWVRETGELTTERLDQHYTVREATDIVSWPDWLCALATLLRPAAASAVVCPPTDRTALRDRIARLSETEQRMLEYALDLADEEVARDGSEFSDEEEDALAELRRLAVEAHDTGTQQQAETEVQRCAHCTHPKGDHDGRADHRAKYSPLVAGDPWCHACNAACDYAPVAQQPAAERDADRIVAYVLAYPLTGRASLHCLRCAPTPPLGDIWTPVMSEELEDGGFCVRCGTDVLIPQQAAAADGEETQS